MTCLNRLEAHEGSVEEEVVEEMWPSREPKYVCGYFFFFCPENHRITLSEEWPVGP